jgi:hypothetical protein
MESEFAKIVYANINDIPWQPQIAKFVSRQKNRLYGIHVDFILFGDICCKFSCCEENF